MHESMKKVDKERGRGVETSGEKPKKRGGTKK